MLRSIVACFVFATAARASIVAEFSGGPSRSAIADTAAQTFSVDGDFLVDRIDLLLERSAGVSDRQLFVEIGKWSSPATGGLENGEPSLAILSSVIPFSQPAEWVTFTFAEPVRLYDEPSRTQGIILHAEGSSYLYWMIGVGQVGLPDNAYYLSDAGWRSFGNEDFGYRVYGTAIPEPSSIVLWGVGVLIVAGCRRQMSRPHLTYTQ